MKYFIYADYRTWTFIKVEDDLSNQSDYYSRRSLKLNPVKARCSNDRLTNDILFMILLASIASEPLDEMFHFLNFLQSALFSYLHLIRLVVVEATLVAIEASPSFPIEVVARYW